MAGRRFCQRCSAVQLHYDTGHPRPCPTCGGVQFDRYPPIVPHVWHLTDSDKKLLRAMRIMED
jgi:NADH pyrophosphatase NudC (nudix superfamily)